MATTSTRAYAFPCSLAAAAPFPPQRPTTAPPSTTTTTTTTTTIIVTNRPSHRTPVHHSPPLGLKIRRREVALLLSLGALLPQQLLQPPPASAFDIRISGPKDWLKEQKRKSAKFLLAPIDASRRILRSAFLLLSGKDDVYGDKELEEVRRLVRTAARDCVVAERDSFVAFQAKTGVEVCTFTLVVNNASSLLDDGDPKKLEAEVKLDDLVRSFTLLNGMANNVNIQALPDREKLAEVVMKTTYFLNKFEEGVRDCLDV